MARMTKRTYEAGRVAILDQIASTKRQIEAITAAFEGLIGAGLRDEAMTLSGSFNRLHDQEWSLEEDLKGLDRDYRRRNWTSYDYQQWAMVCQNID